MTGTSQSTDQPYGQIITDEKALERIFRANYAKWSADAKNRLEGVPPGVAGPQALSLAGGARRIHRRPDPSRCDARAESPCRAPSDGSSRGPRRCEDQARSPRDVRG